MIDHDARFTVVGGGIVGIACAHALQTIGYSVEVIDGGRPDEKCSYGNAGALSSGSVAPLAMPGLLRKVPGMLADPGGPLYIRPEYGVRALPWMWRFARSARLARVEAIAKALKSLLAPAVEETVALARSCGSAELVRRNGQLQLYPDRNALKADDNVWKLRRRMGVNFEDVGRAEIRQLEPAVGPAYDCGVFLPDEGMVVNPWHLRQAVMNDFLQRGGSLHPGCATGFTTGHEGPTEIIVDGHARSISKVLIAAGAWSGKLTRPLGHDVPLETQRGYHIDLANPALEIWRPISAVDRKIFAAPIGGALRIAGTVEFAGLDAPPHYQRARLLLEHGRRLFPDLATGTYNHWMGHRPCLPDSLPVIGRSPVHRNVFFAFGHGHLGLTGAATTAKHIADLTSKNATKIDLSPFRIDRF